MNLDREFKLTLCLMLSTFMWMSVVVLMVVAGLQERYFLMGWAVILAAAAATLSIRRVVKRHTMQMAEMFKYGQEAERAYYSGPRKIS